MERSLIASIREIFRVRLQKNPREHCHGRRQVSRRIAARTPILGQNFAPTVHFARAKFIGELRERRRGIFFDGREERRLASAHPFASGGLRFYERVAQFQKLLYAEIESECSTAKEERLRGALRQELDLSVLMPRFSLRD
jgi:hypothetical protein